MTQLALSKSSQAATTALIADGLVGVVNKFITLKGDGWTITVPREHFPGTGPAIQAGEQILVSLTLTRVTLEQVPEALVLPGEMN